MNIKLTFNSTNFICPHCGVASQQEWFDATSANNTATFILNDVFYKHRTEIKDYKQEAIAEFIAKVEVANKRYFQNFVPKKFSVATCLTCSDITLWIDKELVHPRKTPVTTPNPDMDQEIQNLYIEASTIVVDSPKGATALLRLALQLLLKQLGKSGNNINNDIKELVAEGLSPSHYTHLFLI